MRVYLDSSAIMKRVVAESDSQALVVALDKHHAQGDLLVSSSLAWIEVTRALRSLTDQNLEAVSAAVDAAFSGISEQPLSAEVVNLARRAGPHVLRSLDAIHLASALTLDVDLVVTYDQRLALACADSSIATRSPSSLAL